MKKYFFIAAIIGSTLNGMQQHTLAHSEGTKRMDDYIFDKQITISVPRSERGQINLNGLVAEVLGKINYPREFYNAMPKQYKKAGGITSYRDNDFMQIVPLALNGKPQEFKNTVLEVFIDQMKRARTCHYEKNVRAMILAAIAGGADANYTGDDEHRVECPLWHAQNDLEYAQILVERGARTTTRSKDNSHSLIFTARTLPLAQLFIQHGARTDERTLWGKDASIYPDETLVHFAAFDSEYEPELLKFYLEKCQPPIDVNAQRDSFKKETALDLLESEKKGSYRACPDVFERKRDILLAHGTVNSAGEVSNESDESDVE